MEPFDELRMRRERLKELTDAKVEAYPSTTEVSHTVAHVVADFEAISNSKEHVTIAGRVTAMRPHGGSAFLNIDDGTERIQIYIKLDEIGSEAFKFLEKLDVADFIQVTGTAFLTHRGERSLLITEPIKFLAKALRPLPEKWHGLSDVETRYRKRYLDLLANEEAMGIALTRVAIVRELRNFLDELNFQEVETPMLQAIPGGATARPFQTHLNALDIDLYLRVAPELYLKRLLVGGLPKVYEVARCFRNEGMDHAHNPEFTQVEIYEAYADYRKMMDTMELLVRHLVSKIKGTLKIEIDGHHVDFTAPFIRLDWMSALNEAIGEQLEQYDDEALRAFLLKKGVEVMAHEGRGSMLDGAYKKFVRPHIIQPTFLIDHPVELSPLSKRHHDRPHLVERFQLVLGGGVELINGFSELNDPIDQRGRFEEQEKLRQAGDDEAQRIDEDYLEAMEHGMPPAAGIGMGIDRLAQVLTNQHTIKEVILFPTLRPKND